jgi:hypothetical protein
VLNMMMYFVKFSDSSFSDLVWECFNVYYCNSGLYCNYSTLTLPHKLVWAVRAVLIIMSVEYKNN